MSDQRSRTRVKSLKVDEVSLVDNPANSAARFVLTKRDDDDEDDAGDDLDINAELDALDAELDEIEAELDEGEGAEDLPDDEDEPDDVDELDESDTDADEEDVEAELDAFEGELEEAGVEKAHTTYEGARSRTMIYPIVDALRESMQSIIGDPEATDEMKKVALGKTLKQFTKEASRLVTDGATSEVEKVTKNEGDMAETTRVPLSKATEERLTKLHDENVSLTKRLGELEEERAVEKREAKARAILGKGAKDEDVTQLVTLMKNAPDSVDFVAAQIKKSRSLAKDAHLFEEIGAGSNVAGGVSGAAEALAKKLMDEDPKLTRPKALTKAYETLGDDAYLEDSSDDE